MLWSRGTGCRVRLQCQRACRRVIRCLQTRHLVDISEIENIESQKFFIRLRSPDHAEKKR